MNLRHFQSLLAVVFAAFPVVGVLLRGWDVGEVVLLYWCENVIIGIWTVARMLTTATAPLAGRLATAAFFTVHFGIFCLVHGVFIVGFIGRESGGMALSPASVTDYLSQAALIAVAINFGMHGVGMVREHFVAGERETVSLPTIMKRPYGHIVVVHLAIIGAGFIAVMVPSAIFLLAVMALGKLVLDLRGIYGEKGQRGLL